MLTGAEIEAQRAHLRGQALRVLHDDPSATSCGSTANGSTCRWSSCSRLARTTTVAQLLEREDFATRYARGEPISILELLYPLMQGYDSVAMRADVELGGTDQTFNLLLGRDSSATTASRSRCVLTLPILPGIDGEEKMSKSKGNQIGVAEAPEEMFGKTMRLPDDAMATWFDAARRGAAARGRPRDAKRALAGRSSSASMARTPAVPPSSTSTVSSSSMGCPRRSRSRT